MSLIKTLGHAFAIVASDAVKAARTIETTVIPALKKANADAPTIEAITSLVSPQAAAIERTAFAVLGKALEANDAAVTAVGAGGLNITLDEALVADLKAIAPALTLQAAAAVSK